MHYDYIFLVIFFPVRQSKIDYEDTLSRARLLNSTAFAFLLRKYHICIFHPSFHTLIFFIFSKSLNYFIPTICTNSKNVGSVIMCVFCQKSRLLHSQRVVQSEFKKAVKRMVGKLEYVCGSVLSDYGGTGNDRDEKHLKKKLCEKMFLAQVKLSCHTTPSISIRRFAFIAE